MVRWSAVPQHVLKATFDMAALDFSDRLDEILVPSLCISGRFDQGFPTEMQKISLLSRLKIQHLWLLTLIICFLSTI